MAPRLTATATVAGIALVLLQSTPTGAFSARGPSPVSMRAPQQPAQAEAEAAVSRAGAVLGQLAGLAALGGLAAVRCLLYVDGGRVWICLGGWA